MDIGEFIDRDELRTLLFELISIESVNPHHNKDSGETQTARYIESLLQHCQIPYDIQEVLPDRFNIISRLEGSSSRKLLFEAHMDTASAEGMTIDSFSP